MIKQLLPLIILFFCSATIFGQEPESKNWAPLTVIVTDFKNNIQKGEQILFVDAKTDTVYRGVTDTEGKFDIKIPGGRTYNIKIKSFGEAADYDTLDIPALGVNEVYSQMQLTIQIEQAKTITLDNVHFDTGKSTLTKASFKELDELVEFMKLKEGLRIELAGHTDNVGADQPNLRLSQARADAVKKYLISKGISTNRIVAKGYGESSPVADNDSAGGRQKNRRTEVRIL